MIHKRAHIGRGKNGKARRLVVLVPVLGLLTLNLTATHPTSSARAQAQPWILVGHDNMRAEILRLDTRSGNASVIGPTGWDSRGSGMDMAPSRLETVAGSIGAGALIGIIFDTAASADYLSLVDVPSGTTEKRTTVRGVLPQRGLAFDGSGSLYVVDPDRKLRVLDPLTGRLSLVGPLVDGSGRTYMGDNLTWDPRAGQLVSLLADDRFAHESLALIDPDSARVRVLKSFVDRFSVCSLARSPVAVPGPRGREFDAGTLFFVDGRSKRLMAIGLDTMSGRVDGLVDIGPVGSESSGSVCGSAFVSLIPLTPSAAPTAISTDTATTTPTTSPSSTPTTTPTQSSTETATATSTATSTSTAPPRVLYLPLLLREKCRSQERRADIILVLDASSSMSLTTAAGRSKLEAAIEASTRLLDGLDFRAGDRAGVVAFSDSVSVVQALTPDRRELMEVLAGVRTSTGTCIPCGVEAGLQQLAVAGMDTGRTRALILLTDGQSNIRPIEQAILLADEAKRSGIEVFVIGLGEEVAETALLRMVSRPAFYYRSLDAESLASIFTMILIELPCPASRFWSRR